MKCKDCKNLKLMEQDGEQYYWCVIKRDNPDEEIERYCEGFEFATNAERIRSMKNEILEIFLEDVFTSGYLCGKYNMKYISPGYGGWLNETAESL